MKNLPKKIYLNLGDLTEEEYNELDFHDLSEVTWSEDDVQGRNVEYVLKDAFIKDVCKWLSDNRDHPFIGCEDHHLSGFLTDEFIEEVRKEMEG